jgi:hypothetical protein
LIVDPVQLVKDDVEAGIGSWLKANADIENAGFRLVDPFGGDPQPMGDGRTVAVAWAYKGRHEGEIMGYRPTRRTIDLHGVTLVSEANGEPQFSRFVDWMGGLAALGVGLYNRPIRDSRADAGLE